MLTDPALCHICEQGLREDTVARHGLQQAVTAIHDLSYQVRLTPRRSEVSTAAARAPSRSLVAAARARRCAATSALSWSSCCCNACVCCACIMQMHCYANIRMRLANLACVCKDETGGREPQSACGIPHVVAGRCSRACLAIEVAGEPLTLLFQALLDLALGCQAPHQLILLLRQLVNVLLQRLEAPACGQAQGFRASSGARSGATCRQRMLRCTLFAWRSLA